MKQNKHDESGELIVIISAIVVVLALIGIGITVYVTSKNGPKAPAAKHTSTQQQKSSSSTSSNQSSSSSLYQPVNPNSTNASPANNNVAPATPPPTGGTVAGKFVQPENISWPNDQQTAYVVVSVDPAQTVTKVTYYEAGKLIDTETTPAATGEFQYNWNIANVPKGKYQFTALVFDGKNKSQVVTNNQGNPYLDMYVKSH